MSKKVILDVILLVLTAGIMVTKALYGSEWMTELDSKTE